jgi:hypothetical protein
MSFVKKHKRTYKRTNKRTYKRKTNRTNKKIRNKSKKSKKMYKGGGKWLNQNNKIVENQEPCPICLEKFRETPNKAIYQSNCGHLFHNDCLLQDCNHNNGNNSCPICRSRLGMDCMDVYAFNKKALGNQSGEPLFNNDQDILQIYNNQS